MRAAHYLAAQMRKKVLMVGPVPPPAGGVSIHMTRITHLLKDEFDVDFVDESRVPKPGVLNLRQYKLGQYFQKLRSADVVHIHSGTRGLKYFHIFCAKILLRKKTVLSIHSYKVFSKFLQKLDRLVYSIPEVAIPVGIEIQNTLKLSNRVYIKNAFLPPILDNEPVVPNEIVEWIDEKRKAGNKIAIANAWRLKTHNGADQYGLDLCIDAAIEMKKMNRNICFVYAVSDPHGDLNIKEYEQRITDNNLWDIFYLRKSQVSFVQLIQHSDIVLRPSNTDGDALTVREGLYFNRPVVASDAVKRPEDAILFTNRDAASFVKMIDKVLTGSAEVALNGTQLTGQQYADFYKEIYRSLS